MDKSQYTLLKCKICGNKATKNRQLSAYADDELNWEILCKKCQKVADENWEYRWKEYYSEVL